MSNTPNNELSNMVRVVVAESMRQMRQDGDPRIEEIQRQTKLLTEIITGNGDPSKGLVVRMDRIEHNEKLDAEKRLTLAGRQWALILLVVGNIVSIAFNFLK